MTVKPFPKSVSYIIALEMFEEVSPEEHDAFCMGLDDGRISGHQLCITPVFPDDRLLRMYNAGTIVGTALWASRQQQVPSIVSLLKDA